MSFLKNNIISRNYTVRLFLTSILLTLSSANFAFDNQGFAQTQAMTPFIKRFGDKSAAGVYALPATFLSYSNGFPFIVLIAGIVLGGQISDRFGRRMTVFTMSLWSLCMVPLVITSKTRTQFLIARCLNSLYIGMELSVIPIYQSEIVPTPVRGLAVASYQLSIGAGGLVLSGIAHRTSVITNDWSWRIIFLCFLFVPTIVSSFIWFQPESPRWLLMKGRTREARASLEKFRKPGHDIDLEIDQIEKSIALERKAKTGSTYSDVFKGNNARRTWIVIGSNFFLQATGQAFTSLYGTIIIKQLNTIDAFTMSLIGSSIGLVVLILNVFTNDKFGRRPIMIGSGLGQAIFMFILAGLGTVGTPSRNIKVAMVAIIQCFGISFSIGWAPLSYVVTAETPSQELRGKTVQIGLAVGIVTQFVVAFSLPYMLYAPYGNLGMKVGYIFGPFATAAFIWAYFCLPELKGMNLAQIDALFEERIPARHSLQWNKNHRNDIIVGEKFGHASTDDQSSQVSDSKEAARIDDSKA